MATKWKITKWKRNFNYRIDRITQRFLFHHFATMNLTSKWILSYIYRKNLQQPIPLNKKRNEFEITIPILFISS